jgi:threonine dehydratase
VRERAASKLFRCYGRDRGFKSVSLQRWVCGEPDSLDQGAENIAERASGRLSIHAYDQRETLLGQGGLIAGIAAWFGGKVRVVGVEPESSPTLTMALKAGGPVDAPAGGIAADSLAPRRVGMLVFPIAKRHVDHVVLVPDDAINRAQLALWETLRVVAEPGGAAAFAALISGRYEPRPGEHVGILRSGGNTTAVNFG